MKADARPGGRTHFESMALSVPDMHQTVEHMKETYEQMRTQTDALTEAFQKTCSTAASASADWSIKVAEAMRANIVSNFEFANRLTSAKTLPDVIELSTAHARKQVEAAIAQNKEFFALGQKLLAESTKPLTGGLPMPFGRDASS